MLLFSVVVPVYEHWQLLPRLLRALEAQTVARDSFEIIAVDNGAAVSSNVASGIDGVTIVRCATPGSYAARNAGAAVARGDWLAFTDADCVPDPDWLATLKRAIAEGGDALLAGRIRMVAHELAPNPWQIYDMVKGIPQHRYVTNGYAATANLTVLRAAFDQLGGFDPARMSGGDAEFCRRAFRAGHRLAYLADAVVDHLARDSWRAIATKARRVRGGQMAPGTPIRYGLGALLPPIVQLARLLGTSSQPLNYRLIACLVQIAVWGVECVESLRLIMWGQPERR